jgi:hypothetical protein
MLGIIESLFYNHLLNVIFTLHGKPRGVMVSVLVLSAVDHGFEPQLDQTKDFSITNQSLPQHK